MNEMNATAASMPSPVVDVNTVDRQLAIIREMLDAAIQRQDEQHKMLHCLDQKLDEILNKLGR